MPSHHRPALVAGAAAAVIAVAALVAGAALLGGRPAPTANHDPRAAEDLVAAFQRSRAAALVVESVFTRKLRDGRNLVTTTVTAQRPDSRLVRADDIVSGVLDGREVVCRRDAAAWTCRSGDPVDLAARLEADVAALRRLVTGPDDRRLYTVKEVGGDEGERCFRLRLRTAILAPPYGRRATLCFATGTAAPTRTEIVRAEGVDLTVATRVETDPGPARFALPA